MMDAVEIQIFIWQQLTNRSYAHEKNFLFYDFTNYLAALIKLMKIAVVMAIIIIIIIIVEVAMARIQTRTVIK